MLLYPGWVVNEKGREALAPLLEETVEFLPLDCSEPSDVWVMHALQHIDLGADAIHNARPGGNMTTISKYDFELDDLEGKHFFRIKQAPGSPARKAGHCFGSAYLVSEEFVRLFEAHSLQGLVFKEVFAYRPR